MFCCIQSRVGLAAVKLIEKDRSGRAGGGRDVSASAAASVDKCRQVAHSPDVEVLTGGEDGRHDGRVPGEGVEERGVLVRTVVDLDPVTACNTRTLVKTQHTPHRATHPH